MTNIIQINHLKKSFENHQALKGVSLNIPKGVIFGLLGPNGAGKTTLIRNLTQIYRPDSGEILFMNETLQDKHVRNMGYMPEERGLYKKMKIGEHLIYLGRLKGLSAKEAENKVNKWFSHFQIEDWRNKKIEDLSKGMQQKVQFIATILHEPELLILDEPFSGLDPINANLIKNEMIAMKEKGVTIIFSTHRMESIEEMCEEIALINNGNIILQGNIKAIRYENKKNLFEITLDENSNWPDSLNHKYPASPLGNNMYQVFLKDHNTNELLSDIIASGAVIVGFQETLPTVNEIFIQKVKESNYA
ncbi:MAG: ATP-binding cassette domain-containing protein [Chitinophagales bacterium]|nr:ATP-binding cassette domain-containing protein [Chitinophagales bacterium]MCZ2394877.1 ATP-binding cassette domain-containing protein [Chitinophagales bacterium]